jgi:hypothetical protein
VAKDDDGDIDGAEDGKLVGLLEQAAFALEEGAGAYMLAAESMEIEGGAQRAMQKGGKIEMLTRNGSCRP